MPLGLLAYGFQGISNAGGVALPMPNAEVGAVGSAIDYGAAQVKKTINGVSVNVEALLTKFSSKLGVGGTLMNDAYMGPFTNPSNREMIIQVERGACAVEGICTPRYCISILAHGVF